MTFSDITTTPEHRTSEYIVDCFITVHRAVVDFWQWHDADEPEIFDEYRETWDDSIKFLEYMLEDDKFHASVDTMRLVADAMGFDSLDDLFNVYTRFCSQSDGGSRRLSEKLAKDYVEYRGESTRNS